MPCGHHSIGKFVLCGPVLLLSVQSLPKEGSQSLFCSGFQFAVGCVAGTEVPWCGALCLGLLEPCRSLVLAGFVSVGPRALASRGRSKGKKRNPKLFPLERKGCSQVL